jgi:acetylglutamate kinase
MQPEEITGLKDFPLYLERFRKAKPFAAIKVGGGCLDDRLADAVVFLHDHELYPIVVNGGGGQIDEELKKRGIPIKKNNGKRATDKKTLDVVVPTLIGANKEFVSRVNAKKDCAVGLNGVFYAEEKYSPDDYVRDVVDFDKTAIYGWIDRNKIPVVSCLSVDKYGNYYNSNADNAFCCLVPAARPEKVIMLTPKEGVYDKESKLISRMDEQELDEFIRSSCANGGMELKLDIVQRLVKQGFDVQMTSSGFLLKELFTPKGHGTYFSKGKFQG